VSYPLTAIAALVVGSVEAFSSFSCQQFQGGHRLYADHSGSAAAVAGSARGRGREGLTAMTQRLPIIVFALVMAAIPSSRACRRSGSCSWTISGLPRWWRWDSCS